VNGKSQTQAFSLGKDPRLTQVTDAELHEQFTLAMQVRERTSQANLAVALIREIRSEVADRLTGLRDQRIVTAAGALERKVSAVEGAIYEVRLEARQDPLNFGVKLNNKLAGLVRQIESADARPTEQIYAAFKELSAQLDTELGRLDEALVGELAELNRLLVRAGKAPVRGRTAPTL
jgi:hypothetical protein